MAIPVFFSYSHKDEIYKKTFETHLSILQKQGYISIWTDRKIMVGDDWEDEINLNLQSAKIIFLLVSANFLASEYCYDTETVYAIEQHQKGNAVVIPLILKPCLWEKSNFKHIQACPENGKPISTWKNKDQAWLNVSQHIVEVIEKLSVPILKETNKITEETILKSANNSDSKEAFVKGAVVGSFIEPVIGTVIDGIAGYLGHLWNSEENKPETLETLILRFLQTFRDFYFSPLKIQKWGSKQWSFEKLEFYNISQIKRELEKLKALGKLKVTKSKKGNLIYKILQLSEFKN